MIHVGVVGTGYMGENHVRTYREMEDVKLIGISDPNASKVKELAARYNTLPFADHKKCSRKQSLTQSVLQLLLHFIALSVSTRRVGPYNPRRRDVGVILDIGVHDIDMISCIYGMNINQVYAVADSDIHSFE